MAAENWITVA